MSNDTAENSEYGTNRSRRLRSEELSAEDSHQVELGALSILRAQEIQREKDNEAKQIADAQLRSQVGVYNERRSMLMLVIEYLKLIAFIAVAVAAYIGIRHLLKYAYATKPEILTTYLGQLNGGIIAFVILFAWVALRIYNLWSRDVIYADIDRVRRSRKPAWYLGILKISFEVKTKETRCNVEPTNFETAIKNLGFDASTVDMDTLIERDQPIHNLKYIKDADRLEEIINSIT